MKKPPNDTLGLTSMSSGPMDSDVDNLRSTQTSVMRVTDGFARFGTKRFEDGIDVDGMGTAPPLMVAVSVPAPDSRGETVEPKARLSEPVSAGEYKV